MYIYPKYNTKITFKKLYNLNIFAMTIPLHAIRLQLNDTSKPLGVTKTFELIHTNSTYI